MQNKVFLFAAGFALALLGSCDTDAKKWTPKEGTIQVTVAETTGAKYFSLSTGEEVAPDSNAWDIGFVRPRTILTNSGTTASELGSSGQGGVWHTEKDFDEAVQSDAVSDSALSAYTVDVKKYIYSMSATSHRPLNVMNFTGYATGDGTEENPFRTMQYNQKQFYTGGSGYPVTNIVYIIKHGDGSHYSKIQIAEYEYNGSGPSDTYVVRYENLQ
jgi:hypothetical protein